MKNMYMGMMMAVLCTACGPSINMNNMSPISDDVIYDVIDLTNSLLDEPVDMNGWTIHIYSTNEEAYQVCLNGAGPNAGGCSNAKQKVIWCWWADYNEFNPADGLAPVNGSAAACIAHEMGHGYYYDTTGDSDKTHVHWDEYFGLYEEGSIVNQVWNQYYREEL